MTTESAVVTMKPRTAIVKIKTIAAATLVFSTRRSKLQFSIVNPRRRAVCEFATFFNVDPIEVLASQGSRLLTASAIAHGHCTRRELQIRDTKTSTGRTD
jgi:hypothetical protein